LRQQWPRLESNELPAAEYPAIMDVMQGRPAPLGFFFCTLCRVFALNWEQGKTNKKREILCSLCFNLALRRLDSTVHKTATRKKRSNQEKNRTYSWPRLKSNELPAVYTHFDQEVSKIWILGCHQCYETVSGAARLICGTQHTSTSG
jgi:hypothetical protein